MKPYIHKTTCEICGGDGMLHAFDIGKLFDSRYIIAHDDEEICRETIERRKREKDIQSVEVGKS